METIKITCKADTYLPFKKIQDFQGELKSRTPEDVDHLVYSIQTHGFSFPFFVWRQLDGTCSCLDGHGRILALKRLEAEGCTIPELPVVYIDAKDEADARKKLIHINVTAGKFTNDGFKDLVKDIPDLDLSEYNYPDLDLGAIEKELTVLSEAEVSITTPDQNNWKEMFSDTPSMEEVREHVNSLVPPDDYKSAIKAPEPPKKRMESLEVYAEPETDEIPTDENGVKEMVVNCPQCGEAFVYRFK